MTVVVRRFVVGDTDAVVALWREAFPDDPERNEPSQMIARKVARDPALFWVADDDGVIGVVMAGYDGVRGWLYHLAVVQTRRGEGVARMLVDHAVGELRGLGCPKVNLQVRGSNDGVAAFYEGLGWSEDSSRSFGLLLSRGNRSE